MEKQRGARVRFPPPLVFLISTLLGVALHRYAIGLDWPIGTLVIGIVVIALAVALLASAQTWFRRTGQSPVPWTPTPSLILRGPYRFTRNPMYVGMTMLQVGIGLVAGVPWIAMLALLSLAAVHWIAVVPEEQYLSATFGAPYDEYRARVPRYL